ncbi:Leucyl-tRNA synthetase [Echinococcus granulosus]|uniref:leucine--tRNA ligase n=1 Tax=Echinococcus granulosus TaxID=6210 RepID=W6UY72_ECHGR|nr:Leucyl-tRNA synthetase [Echinococcus granulosus]EUB63552.1 Leucyl-tRNA synthetase [Echinococcus granulosus]
MGWDAFGLPAENAAIDRGVLPDEWTRKNIQNMRKQLRDDMKLSFDWTREIATCNPNYYRWTQWLFIKLFEAGLAYKRLAEVNWDPVDKTVLANELVDAEGRSWRSGALSLKDGLGEIRGQQWRDVIQMQEGWIGPNDGFVVEFDLVFHSTDKEHQGERLAVFTKQPGLAAAGAISFVAVGPQSIFWNERFRFPQNICEVNGSRKLVVTSSCSSLGKLSVQPAASRHPWPERLNISVKHLLTGTYIPLVYDPELHSSVEYETVIELGTPDICDRHRELSRFLDLPPPECQIDLTSPAETDNELRIRIKRSPLPESVSKRLVGIKAAVLGHANSSYILSELRGAVMEYAQDTGLDLTVKSTFEMVPVPEEDLPVELPPLKVPLKRGDAPLKENTEWRHTTCPRCGSPAEREVDTLDTFVDSSWYYLRFLDPTNSKEICSRDNAHKHIPVDIYIGGIEHAIRHLFYARFIAHFLHRELGLLPCREPFRRFLPVGLVMGRTFRSSITGQYFPAQDIDKDSSGKQPYPP